MKKSFYLLLILFISGCGTFMKTAKNYNIRDIKADISELEDCVLVDGMNAAENIYLDPDSDRVYIADLAGSIHIIEGSDIENRKIILSRKVGTWVCGLDMGPDGMLYAAVSTWPADEWASRGGGIYRMTPDLENPEALTGDYTAINGISFDDEGKLYFAYSNFRIFRPYGKVMVCNPCNQKKTDPEVFIEGPWLANGLYRAGDTGILYFSSTMDGVYIMDKESGTLLPLYRKVRVGEATDDFCFDSKRRLFMADPGGCFIKMFDPETLTLTRFHIKGTGQTSSCRIRTENGREILYVTELKQKQKPMSKNYDGRGVFILPVESLDNLIH